MRSRPMRWIATACLVLIAVGSSSPASAHPGGGGGGGGSHGGGGGGSHGGGGHSGGGGHFGGAGHGFAGRGGYVGGWHGGGGYHGGYGGYRGGVGGWRGGNGYRGGWRGGYGYRGGWGGYGWRGGYGGWGWGGLGIGLYFATLPFYYSTLWSGGVPYYYADDNYFSWDSTVGQYETVDPPVEVKRQAATLSPNLIAYPKNGQSETQQATDKSECLTWAAAQSGFDPAQATTQEATTGSTSKRSDYMRAQAACFDGRGYSVQ